MHAWPSPLGSRVLFLHVHPLVPESSDSKGLPCNFLMSLSLAKGAPYLH